MKAVVYNEYGSPDVLHLAEVETPIPKDNEVRIKIHATTVNFGDLMVRNMKSITPSKFTMPLPLWLPTRLMFGFRKPRIKILGAEFAGDVEAVGKEVTQFKVGDSVFGYRGPSFGGNAEYLCVPEKSIVTLKPNNMSYEEAATVPYGSLTALNLLKKVNIQPGQKVLINGASGAIGSRAVQLAKHYGAEVTGVCGTPRLEFVKSLGADHVIDYTTTDFTQSSETYDLIVDVLGKLSFGRCKSNLTENGIYLLASFKMKHLFQMLWTKMTSSKKVVCAMSFEKKEDLVALKEMVEAGTLTTIIDKTFPLEETSEAHRYVEDGHKQGYIVIKVAQEN